MSLSSKRIAAPCIKGCPAGIDVPRYVDLVCRGKYPEAVAVVREKTPFPAVCGYVCYRPCEEVCRRAKFQSAVAVDALKRFACDNATEELWRQRWKKASPTGKKVAVVGSGPAGLTAAYYLAIKGHGVTVFEALPEAGGQLRIGIPSYRLPRSILEQELTIIQEAGVGIQCNSKVDSLDQLFTQGYDAIFLAFGTLKPRRLWAPGEELPKVLDLVTLLKEANLGRQAKVGEKVAVIGGGNVAMDGARTALRLGAREVTIVYRRGREEMPAHDFEVEETLKEGVRLVPLATPVRFDRIDGKLRMKCIRMALGEPDESGRRRPLPVPESEFDMLLDTVLLALGQVPDLPLKLGLETNEDGTLKADPKTLSTSRTGVFAGGDVVTGPVSVIQAIAQGRKGAESIDTFLGGDGDITEVLAPPEEDASTWPDYIDWETPRQQMPHLSLDERRTRPFECVELGLTLEQARAEAARCIRCDLWRQGVPREWKEKTKGSPAATRS